MKLTAVQYRLLKFLLRFHNDGFNLKQIVHIYWPKWVLYLAAMLASFFWVTQFSLGLGYGLTGFFGGMLLRNLTVIGQGASVWQVYDLLYDWEKVKSFVEEYEQVPGARAKASRAKWRNLIIIWLIVFFGTILLLWLKDRAASK